MSSAEKGLWWFGALVLAPLVMLVLVPLVVLVLGLGHGLVQCLTALVRLYRQPQRGALAGLGAVVMLAVLSALVLVLSGCGTAPLPVPTRLQVPAELLTPPAPPVLLTPGSGLRLPGPTTPPTLKAVPQTGLGTSV